MRLPLVIALVAAGLVATGAAPAEGRVTDKVIAHDTLIQQIWALDGDLVYVRRGKTVPERAWMMRYRGHVREARGIPRTAGVADLGLDARGRKVLTFSESIRKSGQIVAAKWFVYDLASRRARRIAGLTTKCFVGSVAVWRSDVAYTQVCNNPHDDGVFLRRGKRTVRLSSTDAQGLSFRGGTLAALWEDGLDDVLVNQYVAHGKRCVKRIDASFGDATSEEGWYPTQTAVVNGYIVWRMGDLFFRPDFKILAASLASGCHTPGPVGTFPFKAETARVQALAVDNRRVFYADGTTLRSHAIPAKPSFAPPPNDDFEQAQALSGDAPLSATGDTAHATAQPGEPLSGAGHSVWYAYRPTTSGTVYVTVDPACPNNPPGDACGGTYRTGVYTGSRPDALTRIPMSGGPYTPVYTRVDAEAGKTYWILVSSSFDPNYTPFTVHVDTHPPG
jgi:hypothetical protein